MLVFLSVCFRLSVGNLQKVKTVIGVELCSNAVEDAKTNACINGKQFVINLPKLWWY